MKSNKYFNNVTFWAREYKLPLFFQILINKNKNTAAFYKNSVVHAYYLNDTEEKLKEQGYKFFNNKAKVVKYKEEVKLILKKIDLITKEYENINISNISPEELEKRFFKVLKFLDIYGKVYLQTEAARLARIDEEKNEVMLKSLGECRFDLRKKGEKVFYILLGVLLKEIKKRSGVKISDLYFYDLDDIKKLFLGKKLRKNIVNNRKKGYVLISLRDKQIVLSGRKFKKMYEEVVIVKSKEKTLSGNTVSKGYAKGRVRVILHNKRNITKDINKFKKGEILVTEMTRPGTVLACKKAAAIITDEGGITSHAAIISRELKIPCVVGTNNATQILKNGDMVEVDAENGVIKLIK